MRYSLINTINPQYNEIEQILTNRGIKIEDVPHYINTSDADNLNPVMLDNIQDAARIIIKHIHDPNGHIALIVD